MSTIYEGTGKPKILFNDTTYYVFPEPIGADKDGLRLYDFDTFIRDQYWSEGGKRNNIGKKFIFNANLKWLSITKEALRQLWKAQKEKDFTFYLNVDKASLFYKGEVISLNYKFFKGIPNHRAGYSVEVKIRGTELLNSPGYTALFLGTGWGTDWGGDAENQ